MWDYIRIKIDGRWVLEHRYMMENHLGRKLLSSEHVHHIDENKRNNTLENLELLTNSEHGKRHTHKAEQIELVCDACGRKFTRTTRYMKTRTRQRFYFCGRTCRLPRSQYRGP